MSLACESSTMSSVMAVMKSITAVTAAILNMLVFVGGVCWFVDNFMPYSSDFCSC